MQNRIIIIMPGERSLGRQAVNNELTVTRRFVPPHRPGHIKQKYTLFFLIFIIPYRFLVDEPICVFFFLCLRFQLKPIPIKLAVT